MEWSDRIGRRIKLRDLHILLAIVQERSMARAAKLLGVSQPAVSKVVSDLEQALGVRLLDRDRHGAEPTIYGEALLKHGVVAFDELRKGVEAVEFLTDPTAGELRIGVTNALAAGLIPSVISGLHRKHPRLSFHVMQGDSFATLHRALRERHVELVFGRRLSPSAEDDLQTETLFDDPFVVVAGHRSRWIGRRNVRLADLVDDPWVLPPLGTAGDVLISGVFQACGLVVPTRGVVRATIQMHDILLARGPYLAMRPASLMRATSKRPSVVVLPVQLPAAHEPFAVITVKARMIGPVARLFIEALREVVQPMATKT